MSKQENNEEENKTITYVFIPDEGVNGVLVKEGAYASTVEYSIDGIQYIIEIPNDEFIVVEEISIGYINEEDENL